MLFYTKIFKRLSKEKPKLRNGHDSSVISVHANLNFSNINEEEIQPLPAPLTSTQNIEGSFLPSWPQLKILSSPRSCSRHVIALVSVWTKSVSYPWSALQWHHVFNRSVNPGISFPNLAIPNMLQVVHNLVLPKNHCQFGFSLNQGPRSTGYWEAWVSSSVCKFSANWPGLNLCWTLTDIASANSAWQERWSFSSM